MKLKAAIIGCGGIARFHYDGLKAAEVDIRWLCDLDAAAPARLDPQATARRTTNFREALADPEVDVAVVTTISSAHLEICQAAIEAGKAVICEKTLTETAADSQQLIEAAMARGTIFYTSYMKRFLPAVEKAEELLPEIGPLRSTHVRAHQPWGPVPEPLPAGEMSFVKRHYGGGILVCGGSHILDLICHLVGRPRRLYATMATPPGLDHDRLASALLETDNGVVHFDAVAHALPRVGFLRDGWDEVVELNGTDGRLEIRTGLWNQFDYKASVVWHYHGDRCDEYRFPAVSPFARADAFFCRNIAAGRQGSQSRRTGYDVDLLISQIVASADSGRPVDVSYQIAED